MSKLTEIKGRSVAQDYLDRVEAMMPSEAAMREISEARRDPYMNEDRKWLLQRIDEALSLHFYAPHHEDNTLSALCDGCGHLFPCPTVRALDRREHGMD